MAASRYVLILQHVPWEGPGLIGSALSELPTHTATVVGEPDPALPPLDELAGLVVMGGPMNADDDERHPGLPAERRLLATAVEAGVPTLGVCLGGQLLARAMGALVERGAAPELGWAPVAITASDDPLLGALAPACPLLHWHTDRFELPAGARHLASTDATPVQAFRIGDAWGLQFHLEATTELMAGWLAAPAMQADAEAALGDAWREILLRQTSEALSPLRAPAMEGLAAFVDLVRARAAS